MTMQYYFLCALDDNFYSERTQPIFKVGSTLFQGCGSVVENKTKFIEKTLSQRCTKSFQCCINIDMTLSQRYFNVASMPAKAIGKPIWLVKSTDYRKIGKFYYTE